MCARLQLGETAQARCSPGCDVREIESQSRPGLLGSGASQPAADKIKGQGGRVDVWDARTAVVKRKN